MRSDLRQGCCDNGQVKTCIEESGEQAEEEFPAILSSDSLLLCALRAWFLRCSCCLR